MDFFEHQDKARRNTGLLVIYFGLAVLCIFGALFVLVSYFLSRDPYSEKIIWDLQLGLQIALGTGLLVGLGSLYKIATLNGGGKVVAESLGGKPLHPGTLEPKEKRLLNIVEEMAIASGTPVPPVYLMEEKSINAFAAGHSPENAVIGVTRGCIEILNREQLQGVMAHEFSHILNGDMRMNIRLIGILHGILLIAGLGYFLMRIAPYLGGGRRNRESGGLGIALLVAGIGMLVIGYVGAFFGGLIKAAVSRQREFLADASAVQFTRNPQGISGALKKIGGLSEGSRIEAPKANECSHMFFGSSVASLFATHPKLEKRIRRIEPNWKGEVPEENNPTKSIHATKSSAISGLMNNKGIGSKKTLTETSSQSRHSQGTILHAGNPTQAHVSHARQIISETPSALLAKVREPFGARCVVFALLLDKEKKVIREKQIAFLHEQSERGSVEETENAAILIAGLSSEQKFALVEIASPALEHLSNGQYATFRSIIEHLVAADERLDLFEWSLRKVIDHDLGRRFTRKHSSQGSASVSRLLPECMLILGSLARHGQEGEAPEPAFRSGASALTRKLSPELPKAEDCGVTQLNAAVDRLKKLTSLDKRSLLEACSRTIDHDGKATDVEIQILRGVAAGISCPLPPSIS
ncbi:MAG: M48 family metallopeptidase [Opitutae bacterium]|nr:M48 family metallopeptidase [Opitutae bacterium]